MLLLTYLTYMGFYNMEKQYECQEIGAIIGMLQAHLTMSLTVMDAYF